MGRYGYLLLTLAAVAMAVAQDRPVRLNPRAAFITTPEIAVGVFPPELAIGPLVGEFKISPDGKYILALRAEPTRQPLTPTVETRPVREMGEELILTGYDVERREAFDLMRLPFDSLSQLRYLGRVEFEFTQPGVAVLAYPEELPEEKEDDPAWRLNFVRVSLANRSVTPTGSILDGFIAVNEKQSTRLQVPGGLTFSHGQPLGVVLGGGHGSLLVVQSLDANGNLGKSITIGGSYVALRSGWSKDGMQMFLEVREYDRGAGTTSPAARAVVVDFLDGSATFTNEVLTPYEPLGLAGQVDIVPVGHDLRRNNGFYKMPGLWLEPSEPTGLPPLFLAGESEAYEVAENLSLIAYTSHGALFIRPVATMPLQAFREAQVQDTRTVAMEQGRMLGLAAIMYAVDHDDQFPPTGTWPQSAYPYMKEISYADKFVLLLAGRKYEGDMSKVVVGYIETPYGRAVVYGDTSTRWEPKPGSTP